MPALQSESQGQIGEFLQVLSKRRWQVVLPAIFLLALGSAISVIIPRSWKVQSRIEVRGLGTETHLQNAQYYIRHFTKVQEIVEALKWPDYLQLSDADRSEYIRGMLDDINVATMLPDSRQSKSNEASAFVDIEYIGSDPARAQFFLNKLVESWQRDVLSRAQSSIQLNRSQFQNERQEARKKVDEISTLMAGKMAEVGVSWDAFFSRRSTTNDDPVLGRLQAVEARLLQINADLAGTQGALAAVNKQWEESPPKVILSNVAPGRDFGAQIAELEGRRATLITQQEGYLQAHPDFHKLQELIEETEEKLAELLGQKTDGKVTETFVDNPRRKELEALRAGYEVRLATLAKEADELEDQARRDRAEYQNRLAVITEITNLGSDLERWELQLTEAEGKFIAATNALSAIEDPDADPFAVVEEAMAPRNPEPPSPVVIVVFAAIAGLAIGLGSALMGEFSRNCYRSVHDVTRVLAIPVLGVVNTIVTGGEIRRMRFRRALVGLSSLVLIGGLAWFTWAWKARQDLLPTEVVQYIDDVRAKMR